MEEVRNCTLCVHHDERGCSVWECEYINRYDAADAYRERRKHGKWHILNDDPYDESGMPKEKGYYRVIDEFGNEYTDLYYAEPRMTPHGIGYWQDGRYTIRAWARMDGEQ